jgi:hypothetical protein
LKTKSLAGGFDFSLVNEKDVKIGLGKSSGLLLAKRAGYSKVKIENYKFVE